MSYEREEAGRQQDATEAMIRMREPRRPSEGPFMPCPAEPSLITLNCENLFYRDGGAPQISGRVWTLILRDKEDRRRLIEFVRVENEKGQQIGEVACMFTASAFALSEDNALLLSLFLAGEWDTLNERLIASVS